MLRLDDAGASKRGELRDLDPGLLLRPPQFHIPFRRRPNRSEHQIWISLLGASSCLGIHRASGNRNLRLLIPHWGVDELVSPAADQLHSDEFLGVPQWRHCGSATPLTRIARQSAALQNTPQAALARCSAAAAAA